MTTDELVALATAAKERADKATAGPWRVDATRALGAYGVWTDYATHPGFADAEYPSQICSMLPEREEISLEKRNANADLIAAARTDVPVWADAWLAMADDAADAPELREMVEKQAARIAELERQLAEAVVAEREACEELAGRHTSTLPPQAGDEWDAACRAIADAIRARGQS